MPYIKKQQEYKQAKTKKNDKNQYDVILMFWLVLKKHFFLLVMTSLHLARRLGPLPNSLPSNSY